MLFFKTQFFIFLFLISFFSQNCSAEESIEQATEQEPQYKFYDVEIILFKQANNSGLNAEYWMIADGNSAEKNNIEEGDDNNSAIENSPPEIELSQPIQINKLAEYHQRSKRLTPYSRLISQIPKENYRLTKEANYLKYSKKYKLLTHTAWKQAGLDKNQALPISFDFGSKTITGNIKIVLSRYLHTKVDFHLIEEVCRTITEVAIEDKTENKDVKIEVQLNGQQKLANSDTDNSDTENPATANELLMEKQVCQLENIQFKQSRKMRSKELHYLDHPVFGLLVQIFPSL